VTVIGYLCEICSMYENMAISSLGSVSEVFAVYKVLCSVFDGYNTESGNSSVSDKKREMRPHNARLVSEEKGDTPMQCVSHISGMHVSFSCNMNKKISTYYSPRDAPCVNTQHAR
jgi:hypothetical protein